MAFPLSFSHKLSFNASLTPSTSCPTLTSKPCHHFIFYPQNLTRLYCISNNNNPSQEHQCSVTYSREIRWQEIRWFDPSSSTTTTNKLEDQLNTPTNSYMSTNGYKKKLGGSLIAFILAIVQISSPFPFTGWEFWPISPANAVFYSPDTKVPRTGELALRRAIPANPSMKTMQDSLEDILYLLRIPQRKPYGTMEGNVKKSLKIATDEKDAILASVPADMRDKAATLHASLIDGKNGLQVLLRYIKDKDADKVSVALASSLDTISELELLQAPGLSFLLPGQYQSYPRLTGRGTVELTIEKGDGSTFTPEAGGEPRKTATIQVVIDGYSAPLTAGNFAKMVSEGAYDGTKIGSTDQAILSASGSNMNTGASIPLEIIKKSEIHN